MATPFHAQNFHPAEYARTIWDARPPHGTTLDQMLNPAFWLHIASQMFGQIKVNDRIEAIPESNEFFAELIVEDAQRSGLVVRVLRYVDRVGVSVEGAADVVTSSVAPTSAAPSDPDFGTMWKGPAALWCVVRKADKTTIFDKLPTKEAALLKLAEHTKAKVA